MKFRTELSLPKASFELSHQSTLFLIGSCFSDTMSHKLKECFFENMLSNPLGVLFHPLAIARALEDVLDQKAYTPTDFFFHEGLYRNWNYGVKATNSNLSQAVLQINDTIKQSYQYLTTADCLFITLGTAWVYQLREQNLLVANCHKIPTTLFDKRLLSITECVTRLNEIIKQLQVVNPKIQIVFTLSPVRHIKDGLIENQRSKAILLEAIHQLVEKNKDTYYFPSYELVLDDLRDYRFFEKDLIHPNEQAIQYIWEQFEVHYMSNKTQQKNRKLVKLYQQMNHLSFSTQTTLAEGQKAELYKQVLKILEQ